MTDQNEKSFWRAFLDFLALLSGVSTASNLERTQGRALRKRGLFLHRSGADEAKRQPPEPK
jgi:hypothetical protein